MSSIDKSLSVATRVLHWSIAVVFLGMLSLGFYITSTSTYSLMSFHKSLGLLAVFLFLFRFFWRLVEGFPKLAQKGLSAFLARSVHWFLLLVTIFMPVSGMIMSIASGRGLMLFEWVVVNANPDANNPGKFIPLNVDAAGFAHSMHVILPWVILVVITLHIAAALRHHFILKDRTLKNMLGKR